MKIKLVSVTVLAGIAGLVLSGCAHQPGDPNTPNANPRHAGNVQPPEDISQADMSPGGGTSSGFQFQPAGRKEVAPPAPGPDYYWVGGYWDWTGDDWQWVKGVWDKPTHAGAKWSQAHWVNNHGTITWERGQWR